MNIYLKFAIAELIAYIIFSGLNAKFFADPKNTENKDVDHYFTGKRFWQELLSLNIENVKGFVERGLLVLGIYKGLPHVIIFFGALKIGSRLDSTNKCKATNNYFILGNLISVIIAILVCKS